MKRVERWHSPRLEREIGVARWGEVGRPLVVFPTGGGDAEEIERFQLVDALGPLIAERRIKVYSLDGPASGEWIRREATPRHCSWLQSRFDAFLHEELLPWIRDDCGGAIDEPIAAGASFGAFQAVAALCRHPAQWKAAIGLSGTYDLLPFVDGVVDEDHYFASPLLFLKGLDGALLDRLRSRAVLLAFGRGRWESPDETWRVSDELGRKGVPNRVDAWGEEFDHDWPTWRRMLPQYVDEVLQGGDVATWM